jgi:hypothetical protein
MLKIQHYLVCLSARIILLEKTKLVNVFKIALGRERLQIMQLHFVFRTVHKILLLIQSL